MKNLFDPKRLHEVKSRLAQLRPDNERQWGVMTPAQALAHCAASPEWAVGDRNPPRIFIGRILGPLVKNKVLKNDEPLEKNSPTTKDLVIRDNRHLDTERERLLALIDRFATGGPAGCTTHPHPFFGQMTAEQWSILTYKHLDHHLRQFGA